MKCAECLPLIEEYIDGELDGRMMERVAAHLSICAECACAFAELSREQEIYALYQRDVEVTPDAWNIVRARVEHERDAQPSEARRERLREWLGGLIGPDRWLRPSYAAALLLVIVGITAAVIYLKSNNDPRDLASKAPPQQDKASTSAEATQAPALDKGNEQKEAVAQNKNSEKNDSNPQVTAAATNAPQTIRQKKVVAPASLALSENRRTKQPTADEAAQFEAAVADGDNAFTGTHQRGADRDFDFEIVRHAERAQLLLRSFRNMRLTVSNRALDVSYEKGQSRKLLYQNIALRRDAATRGDQSTAELLGTLEPILLDIAHLPDRAKPRDVRSIEQRMEKKEIVAALQVHTLVASN
jgi:hypothetical protein